jgi:hypothetical protein
MLMDPRQEGIVLLMRLATSTRQGQTNHTFRATGTAPTESMILKMPELRVTFRQVGFSFTDRRLLNDLYS